MTTGRLVMGYLGWLLLAFAVAALGAIASVNAGEFYASLHKPHWAPPASVFGPVWSVLYAMIGIAAGLFWKAGGFAHRGALALFLAQLAANALWSWLFFAWKLGAAATVDIVLLWVLIVATVVTFWRSSRPAAALLVPYLLWVSFATALCACTWRLNLGAL